MYLEYVRNVEDHREANMYIIGDGRVIVLGKFNDFIIVFCLIDSPTKTKWVPGVRKSKFHSV